MEYDGTMAAGFATDSNSSRVFSNQHSARSGDCLSQRVAVHMRMLRELSGVVDRSCGAHWRIGCSTRPVNVRSRSNGEHPMYSLSDAVTNTAPYTHRLLSVLTDDTALSLDWCWARSHLSVLMSHTTTTCDAAMLQREASIWCVRS